LTTKVGIKTSVARPHGQKGVWATDIVSQLQTAALSRGFEIDDKTWQYHNDAP